MLFLVLEYSLQFHWIICFVLLLWFRILSLWCSGCFGCLKINYTTLRAMITDSMALLWTAGIPPWVLTRASWTQTLWSICWLSLGAHNPVVNIWPGACCRMISGLNWKVNFQKWPGSFYWFGLCLRSVSLVLYVLWIEERSLALTYDLWMFFGLLFISLVSILPLSSIGKRGKANAHLFYD